MRSSSQLERRASVILFFEQVLSWMLDTNGTSCYPRDTIAHHFAMPFTHPYAADKSLMCIDGSITMIQNFNVSP